MFGLSRMALVDYPMSFYFNDAAGSILTLSQSGKKKTVTAFPKVTPWPLFLLHPSLCSAWTFQGWCM